MPFGVKIRYRGPMATHARDRLLQTAEELFYAEGIHAVGVERLLAVSGVGRASFYRHFTGKDALVAAVLTRRDESWRAWLEDAVDARGGGPLAVFDALAEGAADVNFHGCAFINAMAEVSDPASEVYRLAAAHKQAVTDFLDRLLEAAGHSRRLRTRAAVRPADGRRHRHRDARAQRRTGPAGPPDGGAAPRLSAAPVPGGPAAAPAAPASGGRRHGPGRAASAAVVARALPLSRLSGSSVRAGARPGPPAVRPPRPGPVSRWRRR